MKTISVRELRAKSAQTWLDLRDKQTIVITSNGKPVGLLSSTSEDDLEKDLDALRQARALRAVADMQARSVREGRSQMTLDQINAEIAAVRAGRAR